MNQSAHPCRLQLPLQETEDDRRLRERLESSRRRAAERRALAAIIKATSWQAHSVRGFISGTLGKKMGLKVTSTKDEDGERTYCEGIPGGRLTRASSREKGR